MKVNTTKTVAGGAAETCETRQRIRVPASPAEDGVIEVGCNGRMYIIKRGQSVDAPPEVAEILRHAGIIE